MWEMAVVTVVLCPLVEVRVLALADILARVVILDVMALQEKLALVAVAELLVRRGNPIPVAAAVGG